MCVKGTLLPGAIIDGGSGINLMPEHVMQALGLEISRPAQFTVQLADQRSITPVGVLDLIPIEIQGNTFSISFIVIRLPNLQGGFPLLLGRPWLRSVKALHDWGSDQLWITLPGLPNHKLNLEEGMDPSAQTTSFSVQSETLSPSTPLLEVDEEDASLLQWLDAMPSASCHMLSVQSMQTNQPQASGLSSVAPPNEVAMALSSLAPLGDVAVALSSPTQEGAQVTQVPGPKTPNSWAPESDPLKPRHSTITPTENSSSPSTDESFESIGLGEPITSRHRGKRQTLSPLQRDSDPPLTLIPPTPASTPVPSSPLPMEDIPQAWLEERIGDFPID